MHFLLWTFIFNLLISVLITLQLNSLSEGNRIHSATLCAYYFLLQELQIWHLLASFVYSFTSVSTFKLIVWEGKNQEEHSVISQALHDKGPLKVSNKFTISIFSVLKSYMRFVNLIGKNNTHTYEHHIMFSSLHLILTVVVNTFISGVLVYLILETILKLQVNITF